MKAAAFALILALAACAQSYDSGKVDVGHKAAHFVIGFSVAWGGGVLGHHKTGLALGIGLGIAKEMYDHRHSSESAVSHRRDILITSAGAFAGYLVSRHFYPDGADLSGGHGGTSLYQQEQHDRLLMAEFRRLNEVHP